MSPVVRSLETVVLLRAFGKAFGVEIPSLRGLSPDDALMVYREFTAACMEMALEDKRLTSVFRPRLGTEARRLGRAVRMLVPFPRSNAFAVARYFYRGIGIGLHVQDDGALRFCPCLFAERYTPADCWFMSAFDEGFLQGLLGHEYSSLVFSRRLTEGAPHCIARFETAIQRGLPPHHSQRHNPCRKHRFVKRGQTPFAIFSANLPRKSSADGDGCFSSTSGYRKYILTCQR